MASSLERTFQPVKAGEYVTGALVGSTNLASGRFAMLEILGADGGLGFALVPWQPVLDKRIGQHISGIALDSGDVDWRASDESAGWGCEFRGTPWLHGAIGPDRVTRQGWRVSRPRFAACGLDVLPPVRRVFAVQLRDEYIAPYS